MGSCDKAVFAGNAIALHDLRQSSQDLSDHLELSRNRPDAQPSRNRQAQSLRVDRQGIAFDHADFLQALDPFGHARRRQADRARQVGDADPRVVDQGIQDSGVGLVTQSLQGFAESDKYGSLVPFGEIWNVLKKDSAWLCVTSQLSLIDK